jgi:hypothetical protein
MERHMSELLTVRDVATVLKCSDDAVVKRFAKMPGVIDLGKAETRNRRQYRVLRIPKAVVEKYLTEKSRRPIQIQVPERAERRRRSPKWEDKAILNLAKAGLQNGATNKTDKKTYQRIADLAAFLARAVPESEWAEITWCDDDE